MSTNIVLVPPVFVNLAAFNIFGDGVNSDVVNINNALATIPTTTGGVLYTPPNKTCLIDSPIDLSAYSNNLVLLGGGWSSCWKLANGTNDYIIKSTSGSMQGARVQYMKFDCNGANQTGASGAFNVYKWRRCLFEHVWIHGHYETGILLNGAGGDFGYQNDIKSCFIEGGLGMAGKGRGLYTVNCDENTISDCLFQDNGGNDTSAGDNFHIRDDNGLNVYKGNKFVNGLGVFKLYGLQTRIIGNTFDGNGDAAVQINSSATDAIITGNEIFNIGYRASGGSANSINGIYVNATRCIIKDNNFASDTSATPKTKSFINIDTGATYSEIKDNEMNVKASSGTLTGPITFVSGLPTGTRVQNNIGYDFVNSKAIFTTENYGTASITTGNTSIVVNHGLAMTPTLQQIMVTPQTSLGSAAFWWIDTVTSTQFTIHTNANPAGTVTFGWIAKTGW